MRDIEIPAGFISTRDFTFGGTATVSGRYLAYDVLPIGDLPRIAGHPRGDKMDKISRTQMSRRNYDTQFKQDAVELLLNGFKDLNP